MANNKPQLEIPDVAFFEQRFHFIKNETLKSNLAISIQYVAFLIKVETDLKITGAVEYSIFKNIIQYTASIVEGILHYGLEVAFDKGLVEEHRVMPKAESFSERKLLHQIDRTTKIEGVKSVKKHEKFKKNTQFKTVCDAYKKGKLIDANLIKDINELREKRNKIHLAGLTKVENYYTKNDINQAFEVATEVIKEVEKIVLK